MTHLEKAIELLYDARREKGEADDTASHWKHQTERCHDYIRHLSHELDVVKNIKKPVSGDYIKERIQEILVVTTGRQEEYFSEVECISAFIEAHFVPKELER